ncbi:hypothetical protein B1C81_25540 [Streptomyces sp. HG99]|nr:hypothetical protein B1C81_25540 [Streptomyces sp. HG99]
MLPSDGSAPLLPGMTGDRTTPAGGQAWGQPWGPDGPDQPTTPAPGPGQGWGAPGNETQAWGATEPPQSAPVQDWGTHDASQGWAPQQQPGAHDHQQQSFAPQQPQQLQQPPSGAGPLPPEGAQATSYGAQNGYAPGAQGAHVGDGYGGYAAPGQQAPQFAHPGNALPQGADGYGAPGALPASSASPSLPAAAQAAPLPPAGLPLPAAADDGATQYIPHIPAAPGADEGATQYIPPVGPGALPPEMPAEATQFLGQAPQGGAAGPLPPTANPDAEATQFMAPVPAQPEGAPYGIRPGAPEERQPPAEFDNLFRSEPESPGATQQMPRFDPSAPLHGAHAPAASGGRAAARRAGAFDGERGGGGRGGGRGGRGGSRVPLIAAVGVGIAVLGIGAGALLSGGGTDGEDDKSKTVSATSPATESASASADPVKAQAVALDKLLADSSDSRDSVIKAVANVKVCQNLDQAASDLRDAAKQRGELVTRLSALSVDKLPNHAALTAALTSGWKASQSADNHYAAWADQTADKKGCRRGQARTTAQTQAGNRASGTASTEKEKAAKLWNSIASTYGLTQRTRTQL